MRAAAVVVVDVELGSGRKSTKVTIGQGVHDIVLPSVNDVEKASFVFPRELDELGGAEAVLNHLTDGEEVRCIGVVVQLVAVYKKWYLQEASR